ncbi:MAG: 2-hydroxyacyl-CoA dehydratase [Spirochaetes bacterium]|nr:2-hydroxyacyl-CoA dehydratase [Spirochaetota bacterium]
MTSDSRLSSLVDPLRELLQDIQSLLSRTVESREQIIAGFSCDFLPFEIVSAAGIFPYVIPEGEVPTTTDAIVVPAACRRFSEKNVSVPVISVPLSATGYGETALPQWEQIMVDCIERITGARPRRPDPVVLAECTERYNSLRRLVRGIASLRREKPSLLSNRDLQVMFDAALCLPPDTVINHLKAILDALNTTEPSTPSQGLPAMVYGSFSVNQELFDKLEDTGFLVVEDDTCRGRRSFDMSHDTSSPDLYREILHAHSFRPFCPCMRGVTERFELLYRLAASYGIETVILIDDDSCPAWKGQIGRMRVRLMRAGLDPLVVTPANAVETARRYIELASL